MRDCERHSSFELTAAGGGAGGCGLEVGRNKEKIIAAIKLPRLIPPCLACPEMSGILSAHLPSPGSSGEL